MPDGKRWVIAGILVIGLLVACSDDDGGTELPAEDKDKIEKLEEEK